MIKGVRRQVFHHPQHPATAGMDDCYAERYRILEPFSTTLDDADMAGASSHQDITASAAAVAEQSIGEGAYGKVYKARDRCTGRLVALKKVKCECCEGHDGVAPSTLREVTLLLRLRHENVVQLLDVKMCDSSQRLVMVFELLDMDLHKYLRSQKDPLEKRLLQSYSAQLLEGVAFCHSMGIIHRDLKPHNVLVDSRGALKIADFGLARNITPQQRSMTVQVVTRYYRSPELLLGHKQYDCGVDMWSVACIIAEMASGRVLFQGDCDIDQLFRIFKYLGTPGAVSPAPEHTSAASFSSIAAAQHEHSSSNGSNDWAVLSSMPHWNEHFPMWTPLELEKLLPELCPDGISLLKGMLQLAPPNRTTARSALLHRFVDPNGSRAAAAAAKKRQLLLLKPQRQHVVIDRTQTPAPTAPAAIPSFPRKVATATSTTTTEATDAKANNKIEANMVTKKTSDALISHADATATTTSRFMPAQHELQLEEEMSEPTSSSTHSKRKLALQQQQQRSAKMRRSCE